MPKKTNPDKSKLRGISAAALGGALQSDREQSPGGAAPAQSAQPVKKLHKQEYHVDIAKDDEQGWRRAAGGNAPKAP